MNSFLLSVAALLVLALSALFFGPHFIDWNDYREHFEAQASGLIGRKVDVGGDVSLNLLPTPVLRFENVNVADRQGGFETPFAAARSFTVWLAVPPLLRGTIEAREVEITQPVLNLRVDDDGVVNWSDVGGKPPDLPFIPRDVTLNSVMITGATVAFWRGGAEPAMVLEQLSGELSARSLKGPYKFAGRFNAGVGPREVRFSTTRREPDGAFRLKVLVRGEGARAVYSLDGTVKRFGSTPAFDGQLLARFADSPEPEKTADEQLAAFESAPVTVKAAVDADFERARFDEVEIAVRRNNKPQTVNGRFEIAYTGAPVLKGDLKARWVDLDSWTGPPGGVPARPDKVLAGLAEETIARLARVDRARLGIAFDQAVLSGDLVNDLKLDLSANGGEVNITRLAATLPGENAVTLQGALSSGEAGPVFTGMMDMRGGTLAPLLRWTGADSEPVHAAQTGEFALRGELTAASDRLFLENAAGSLYGSAFTGGFRYEAGAEREIAVTLESERLDLARAFGAGATPAALWRLLGPGEARPDEKRGEEDPDAEDAQAGPLDWLGGMRAHADVRIGTVSLPGLGDSRLEASLAMGDGALDITRLKLTAGKKASVEAGGRLTGLGRNPEGKLTIAARAANAEGLSALARFFALPGAITDNPARVAAMMPLQLTSTLRLKNGEDAHAPMEVRLEGSAGGSEALVELQLDDAARPVADSRMDLEGRLTNAEGKTLLRQLFPHLGDPDLQHFESGKGIVAITAKGVAKDGLDVTAELDAAGLRWNAAGRAVHAEEAVTFTGESEFKAHDVAAPLLLAGAGIGPAHAGGPLTLKSDVETAGWRFNLPELTGEVSGIAVSGGAKADLSGAKPAIEVDLTAERVSLPRLLGPVLSWDAAGEEAETIRGVSRAHPYWPDRPFNTALLGRFDGQLALKADRLKLAGGLTLDKAALDARLTQGSLQLAKLEGGLYGGTLAMNGKLAAQGSGMALELSAQAKDMRLERIAANSGGKAAAEGPLDVELSATGEGLTPSGVAAGLAGEGRLALGAGRVRDLSPRAAGTVAQAAVRNRSGEAPTEDSLAERVAERLKTSDFSYRPVTAPFTVRNGVVRLEKLEIEGGEDEGHAAVTSYLQLATLDLDSEWVLQPDKKPGDLIAPQVSLVFTGSLEEIGTITPTIGAEALVRYVTMNRMEQDVERLERLDVSGRRSSSAAAPPAPKPKPASGSGPKRVSAPGDSPPGEEPAAGEPAEESARAAPQASPPPAGRRSQSAPAEPDAPSAPAESDTPSPPAASDAPAPGRTPGDSAPASVSRPAPADSAPSSASRPAPEENHTTQSLPDTSPNAASPAPQPDAPQSAPSASTSAAPPAAEPSAPAGQPSAANSPPRASPPDLPWRQPGQGQGQPSGPPARDPASRSAPDLPWLQPGQTRPDTPRVVLPPSYRPGAGQAPEGDPRGRTRLESGQPYGEPRRAEPPREEFRFPQQDGG